MLYIVSTPIGNLKDVSARMRETLEAVGLIIMESPTDSKPLLNALGISGKRIIKYNDINSRRVLAGVVEELKDADGAYISSAGTPGISDPGADLVREARRAGIGINVIPGPSALVSAIAGSGIRADQFTFISFLPRKAGPIKKIFEVYRDEEAVLGFFESPFRIVKTLEIVTQVAPECYVCAAKEITKMFENYFTGTPSEVCEMLLQNSKNAKGEFTVVIDFRKRRK